MLVCLMGLREYFLACHKGLGFNNSSYAVESNQKKLTVREDIFIFGTVQQSKTNDLTMLTVVDCEFKPILKQSAILLRPRRTDNND
jgi:hypothetical protein